MTTAGGGHSTRPRSQLAGPAMRLMVAATMIVPERRLRQPGLAEAIGGSQRFGSVSDTACDMAMVKAR